MNLRHALVSLIAAAAVGIVAAPLTVAAEQPPSQQDADEMLASGTSSGVAHNGFAKPE